MEILLEEFYQQELHVEKFHPRKCFIYQNSYQIIGISQSGKTHLVKNYLLSHKKNSYLYIDCSDIRIELILFNTLLPSFCLKNKIDILVFDNYTEKFTIPNVTQLLLTSEKPYKVSHLEILQLYPLDYEEFLAYQHKYDSSALNHFFQLGGLPSMHRIYQETKHIYIQKILKMTLSEIEFEILKLCAKFVSQKISPYMLYERLKQVRKISKDKLYLSFQSLKEKNYIHLLEKFNHKQAIKRLYLCDISIKTSLDIEKNFAKLFENMVFLELLKSNTQCFYADDIDFYIPQKNEIILCKPFADERRLFKKLEALEAFLVTHSILHVSVITMNKEGSIAHPLAKVAIIPFDIWALGD